VPDSFHDEVEVLTGTHGKLRWRIWTAGTEDNLLTMLQVFDGDRCVAESGFGGPALHPDRKVNQWRGRTDDLPYFVMARAAPEVSRLVAVTDRGTHVELVTGRADNRFGLRFAAAGLPDGEGPGVLLVEVDGRPDGSIPQPMGWPSAGPGGHDGPLDSWRPFR
jgi:hypothetical protein